LEGSVEILDRLDNIFVERSPLRKGPPPSAHVGIFTVLYEGGFTFLGVYNAFWFCKDLAGLAQHFGGDDGAAKGKSFTTRRWQITPLPSKIPGRPWR